MDNPLTIHRENSSLASGRRLWFQSGSHENRGSARPSPPSEFRRRGIGNRFRPWLLPLWMVACGALETPVYQDKQDLLHYLDPQGNPHPVENKSDWSIRRAHTLQNMQRVMGPLPELPTNPLAVQVLETETLPQVLRKKITFVSEVVEGEPDRVPAYLLIPNSLQGGTSAPAVLCLHQTIPIGKAEPAGLGGSGDLDYALELARLGYVTLAPDYPRFGDYQTNPYALGYVSATMKGIVNHRRAIDLLQTLPEVDGERIGVIGHSLGGHNALFLAAFDSRVRAVVTSCGFNAFKHYDGGDLTGWSHQGYMPHIAQRYGSDAGRMPFDFTEVLGILAPRPVFISAPVGDHNFDIAGVRDCIQSALPVYEHLFESPDRLVWQHPQVGHEFPSQTRQDAYRFLKRWLTQRGRGRCGGEMRERSGEAWHCRKGGPAAHLCGRDATSCAHSADRRSPGKSCPCFRGPDLSKWGKSNPLWN